MQTLQLDKNKLLVFVHISGPKETRRPIILKIIEASQNIPDIQFIFSEGKAKGNIIPEKISKNIWYYEWCPCRDEIFHLIQCVNN